MRKLSALLLLPLLACGSKDTAERVERTERDQFGLITCSEQTDTTTCYTHRAIMGVSMGSSGAGQLAFQRPELFDQVGMLGVPLVDWVFMLRGIQRGFLGGFCDRETILANMGDIANPTGAAFCGPAPSEVKLEPSGQLLEPQQDYNHWYRWIDEGRGGGFGRNKLRESFQDIALAFGNPVHYNEESPYYPPGVPMDFRFRTDAERCASAFSIEGHKNKEYNPDGTYPVIAFCDTATNEGEFLQDRPSERATEILLAVDYNRNGIRDYAEPILIEAHERFEDAGTSAGDRYDWETNPQGKADNWLYDDGEPYEDTGLDGVAGTGDFGEGNGKFDYNPNVLNYHAQNPRELIADKTAVPDGHLARMSIYADAGIRDFLQSAGGTNWLWGTLKDRVGGELAKDYTHFATMTPELGGGYDFLALDYSAKGIGQHAYVRYGNPAATQREIDRGDGHHVGPADQVLQRFLTGIAFVENRFLDRDVRAVNEVGDITNLILPKSFMSTSLNEERKYGVVLPPGYNRAENAENRYPVIYFLHGQGQESQDLLASAILFFGYMAGSSKSDIQRKSQSDWSKFIIVFPDSTCSGTACASGNFNANHRGIDGNGPKYMDSLFELMAIVERDYRVAIPVEVRRDSL
jgi:predicted alpha/beta superfamily hydrolase